MTMETTTTETTTEALDRLRGELGLPTLHELKKIRTALALARDSGVTEIDGVNVAEWTACLPEIDALIARIESNDALANALGLERYAREAVQ
jgi:hypothetical protein